MSKQKLLYPFNIITLSILLIIIFGCTSIRGKELSLPATSEQFTSYYKARSDSGVSTLYLISEYQQQTKHFNEQEAEVVIKGYHWSTDSVNTSISYYEVGEFKVDEYFYKLMIYNRDGEADTPLLNIQLSSYNRKGVLVDALLLDSHFYYEEIERFTKFVIADNDMIDIDYYITYYNEEGEDGIGAEIKNPVPQMFAKEQYKIEKGIFQLTAQNCNDGSKLISDNSLESCF